VPHGYCINCTDDYTFVRRTRPAGGVTDGGDQTGYANACSSRYLGLIKIVGFPIHASFILPHMEENNLETNV